MEQSLRFGHHFTTGIQYNTVTLKVTEYISENYLIIRISKHALQYQIEVKYVK